MILKRARKRQRPLLELPICQPTRLPIAVGFDHADLIRPPLERIAERLAQ
jgi:hypothetical protein